MKSKIIAFILAMLITTQITLAAPFNGNAKTKRMPAGTNLQLKMLNGINTSTSTTGNSFSAMLLTGTNLNGSLKNIIV